MARGLARGRFWGRGPLAFWLVASLAVPPAFGALGLRWLLGATGWLGPVLETPGLGRSGRSGPEWLPWVIGFWVTLTTATAWVGLAVDSALRKVDPSWEEAALWAGAGRRRAWRRVVWPVVRPEVARALALVFTLTLLEPGVPCVLGLRRTLGFQIVEAARSVAEPGQRSRAVVLALLGVSLVMVGRVLIGWWGGKALDPPPWRSLATRRSPAASWPVAGSLVLVVLLLGLLAWLPGVALAAASLSEAGAASYRTVLLDPLTRGSLVNAALLGLAVVLVDLILARLALAISEAGAGRLRGLIAWPEAIPPLAIGAGALALPGLLAMIAGPSNPSQGVRGPTWRAIAMLSEWVDPDQTAWVAMILVLAAVRLPWLARSARASREALDPVQVDCALTLGATRREARRRFEGGWGGVSLGALAMSFALAATSVSPALILSPTAESRPLGPAVIVLADAPGDGLARAAALGSIAVVVNLAAIFALACLGGRPDPVGRRFSRDR
jgi:ABC-type Fe3+ transport system permease subunit